MQRTDIMVSEEGTDFLADDGHQLTRGEYGKELGKAIKIACRLREEVQWLEPASVNWEALDDLLDALEADKAAALEELQ
ncbi:MAG: hypothetical protein ABI702_19670 [Burkholderiales bacterium]